MNFLIVIALSLVFAIFPTLGGFFSNWIGSGKNPCRGMKKNDIIKMFAVTYSIMFVILLSVITIVFLGE